MRNFGVEIEFISTYTRNQMCTKILRETGVSVEVANYYNKDNKWRLKHDGSIASESNFRNGMELVTPILSTKEDLETLCKIVDVCDKYGKINRSCGVHVHTDITSCGAKPMRKLMKFLCKYEHAINQVLPKSRRGDNNSYCRNTWGGEEMMWNEFLYLDSRTTTDRLMTKFGRGKWNFQNYVQHGSFENRSHGGTLNSTKIRNWVKLNQAIVQMCFDKPATRIYRADTCKTYKLKDMLAELVRKGYIDNPMKSYYLNREEDLR